MPHFSESLLALSKSSPPVRRLRSWSKASDVFLRSLSPPRVLHFTDAASTHRREGARERGRRSSSAG
jgi:hypothetical protein